MSFNKLVIRRLPPSMSEDDFLKQISPLPRHDYFCFFEANSGLGPHSFSRAYINFLDLNDMSMFRERFDNYVFLDQDGHEYPAVVEQSLWHKSPKNGPFFKSDNAIDDSETPIIATDDSTTNRQQDQEVKKLNATITHEDSEVATSNSSPNSTTTSNSHWIEQDPEFVEFIEKLKAQKRHT